MAYTLGFVLGMITVACLCGVGSYFIWQKATGNSHDGKKVFFAFLSFFIAGLFGIVGGIPILTFSYFVARYYKKKTGLQHPPQQEHKKEAS